MSHRDRSAGDNENVRRYYDGQVDREWDRLARHRLEFAITERLLADYLPSPPADVIEVGCGPGRYSLGLIRRGYRVTMTDLSPASLEFAAGKLAEAGLEAAEIFHADARDLGCLPDAAFDAVLLLGPLYHLLTDEDRKRAVREARRICRPGGVIVASFISRYAALQWAARDMPDYLIECAEEWQGIMADGTQRVPGDPQKHGFTDAWFCRVDQIAPLMAAGGFESVALVGADPLVTYTIDEESLPADQLSAWVDALYAVADDPSIVGAACHPVYIGRAPTSSEPPQGSGRD